MYFDRKINCGSLDGMFYTVIKKKFPDLYNAWWGVSAPFAKRQFPFPGGENFKQIVNRGKSAAKHLLSEISIRSQNILVVSSGSINTVITATLLGLDPDALFATTYFENCGLIKIDTDHFSSDHARWIIN